MTDFIDLDRRFREASEAEVEDYDRLEALSFRDAGEGWDRLLESSRVVLLAGAGSGKTTEMKTQARRLSDGGSFAVFVNIEELDRYELWQGLSVDERTAFDDWKNKDAAPGWFFLDAVDELKLTGGRFDQALRRIATALHGHLDRARLIISCRPSDWRPDVDRKRVQELLPVPPPPSAPMLAPDESFLTPLRRRSAPQARTGADDDAAGKSAVRTVVMAPLDEERIKRFAHHCGVVDTKAFLDEIERQDAWTFARRPLDLAELASIWTRHRRLGTRLEQHESSTTARLRDDPERRDRDVITNETAREGAERLALALSLTRTRSIRVPEQSVSEDRPASGLDAAAVLQDWTEAQRQALLRRAIFDPATYGRVRFHHRSVEAYLAACRLRRLRERGMAIRALLRLLFAERYGASVVIPSMRPIAAWLALWDADVRRELMRREPETLLTEGDPGSLDMAARRTLLRAVVKAYGRGGWRGLRVQIDQVKRLADPELAEIIRNLWDERPANEEVRQLLLRLIAQGPIRDCADIAGAVALDPHPSQNERIDAVNAVVACGDETAAGKIAASILGTPSAWPARVICSAAAELFPAFLTVGQLIKLMETTDEPRVLGAGFSWWGLAIAGDVDPWSDAGVELRNGLADLIRRHGRWDGVAHRATTEYKHLVPALLRLCQRQLAERPTTDDAGLLRAVVIALRFGEDSPYESAKNRSSFAPFIGLSAQLRARAFWTDFDLLKALSPSDQIFYHLFLDGALGHLVEGDHDWLKAAAADTTDPQRRGLALKALLRVCPAPAGHPLDRDELRRAVADDPDLLTLLESLPARDEGAAAAWEAEAEAHRRARDTEEADQLDDWRRWRGALLADPAAAFGPAKCESTLANLLEWLCSFSGSTSRYSVWDREALEREFGTAIADRAAAALQAWWRKNPPALWSGRPEAERNSVRYAWIWGLCGIASEAQSDGWAARLTADEARTAVAYATIELNDFPSWIDDLVAAHPQAVEAVLAEEVDAELAEGDRMSHLSTLQLVARANVQLKRCLAPRLRPFIEAFQPPTDEAVAGHWAHHILTPLLAVLEAGSPPEDRANLVAICERHFRNRPGGRLSLVWLRALFRLDPERAMARLEEDLSSLDEAAGTARVVEVFAALGGFETTESIFSGIEPLPASVLDRLVRLAFRHVREEDDHWHVGFFTPDRRDRAQDARRALLKALIATPGPEACGILLRLAEDPSFSHLSDRLKMHARQRAAEDAEFTAWTPSDIGTLDASLEAHPKDRNSLFSLMMDRLDDLQHDLAHGDFSDRRTLRTIKAEAEMQRTLAARLRERARECYTVARETEVADRKEPDILLTVGNDLQAVIEIKIADSWTVTDLEKALSDQLVGQYLRHDSCKAGCLLLTYHGRKQSWEHPQTGTRLAFSNVVEHLSAIARDIEPERLDDIRVGVFGLDLTGDPGP